MASTGNVNDSIYYDFVHESDAECIIDIWDGVLASPSPHLVLVAGDCFDEYTKLYQDRDKDIDIDFQNLAKAVASARSALVKPWAQPDIPRAYPVTADVTGDQVLVVYFSSKAKLFKSLKEPAMSMAYQLADHCGVALADAEEVLSHIRQHLLTGDL